jgi:hypothetical protein
MLFALGKSSIVAQMLQSWLIVYKKIDDNLNPEHVKLSLPGPHHKTWSRMDARTIVIRGDGRLILHATRVSANQTVILNQWRGCAGAPEMYMYLSLGSLREIRLSMDVQSPLLCPASDGSQVGVMGLAAEVHPRP